MQSGRFPLNNPAPGSRLRETVLAASRGALFLAALAGGAFAHAQSMDSIDTPWIPEVIQAVDAYVPDPAFVNGRMGLDHFAGPNSADQVGALTAQLSNGDIVVAGLVPNFGSSGTCSNGTAMCNIGLVRYNQAGVRKAWTNPGEYGNYANNYIIFPAGIDAHKFQYIRDVKVLNGIIYVLVDEQVSTQAGLGRQDVRIVAFGEDGGLKERITVFGNSFTSDPEDFYGAQMVLMSNNRMIVTATDYDGTSSYLAATRLTISGAGILNYDVAWGVGYGGEDVPRLIRYPASSAYTVGYAVNQVGFPTQDDFYVAGSYEPQGDSDVVVLKISSLTGAYKPEFGNNGFVGIDFAEVNSSRDDYAAGLYVYRDDVYVGAQVSRKCHNGIGLAKLNGATGAYITAFGGSGKVVFGGQGNATLCYFGNNRDVPFAISATGGRIGVAGYGATGGIVGGGTNIDPMLAVVDAVNGSVLDFARHPILRANGTRAGDGVLYSVYGGPNATSPFTAAGNGRDTSAGNTLSYLVGRFVPVSADRIFANNFD